MGTFLLIVIFTLSNTGKPNQLYLTIQDCSPRSEPAPHLDARRPLALHLHPALLPLHLPQDRPGGLWIFGRAPWDIALHRSHGKAAKHDFCLVVSRIDTKMGSSPKLTPLEGPSKLPQLAGRFESVFFGNSVILFLSHQGKIDISRSSFISYSS